MDKQQLLKTIHDAINQGVISRDEVLREFTLVQPESKNQSHFSWGISNVFYLIGALIVFIGITVLISQNWSILSVPARILCTLGFAIVSYIAGELLTKEEKYGSASNAFHLIAALSFPLGLIEVLYELKVAVNDSGVHSFVLWVLFLFYVGALLVRKKMIFAIFSIIYGMVLFFTFTRFLVGGNPLYYDHHLVEYQFLIAGLSLGFLGNYLNATKFASLSEVLYGFSSLFTLGSILILGGWKPEQNYYWEIIFPFIVSGVLYLSVRLKSRTFLIFGTLFLMGYIVKITGEYFSGTLGWPFSLMICGIAFIGIGYYAFRLNKKYLSKV